MKVKETRWMDMDDLRGLCIKHGWYTRGDCKAYDKPVSYTHLTLPTT